MTKLNWFLLGVFVGTIITWINVAIAFRRHDRRRAGSEGGKR